MATEHLAFQPIQTFLVWVLSETAGAYAGLTCPITLVRCGLYEPTMDDGEFLASEVTHDLEGFKRRADVIVANRWNDELVDVRGEGVHAGSV